MKSYSLFKIIVAVSILLAISTQLSAQSNEDTTAIKSIVNDETLAWNRADATGYAKDFAENGTFTNIQGMFFKGHQIFLEKHDMIFKTIFKGTTLKQTIVALQFAGSNTAIVETLSSVSGLPAEGGPKWAALDEKGRLRTRLLQVIQRTGGKWKIIAYHNVDVKAGIPVPE